MNEPHGGGDYDFYARPTRGPAFHPGGTSFTGPGSEPVRRRAGRNPLPTLLAWAVVLVLVAIGVKYGYPAAMDKVRAKEIASVTTDLENVAAGQQSYYRLNGSYSQDLASLGIPGTVSDVTVVSANSVTFCLKGTAVAGGVTRYLTATQKVSDRACS